MKIISHRGYWKNSCEKNKTIAFRRSFRLGFGTETDFRDKNGNLVVEHDLPGNESMPANVFFDAVAEHSVDLEIAINIKSDGLQDLIKHFIDQHGLKNYFLFDMSVPDAVVSIKKGLKTYTRHSDLEPFPAFYAEAVGVWMDAFNNDAWITPKIAMEHVNAGKRVCIVSPEIHNRPYLDLWYNFRNYADLDHNRVTLCTDLPEVAAVYFKNEKN
jgi:hypothetical protein